jgi:Uma2 family endonuclease
MNEMVDQFRAIADAAPKDPDAFVRWVSEHPYLEQMRLKLELSHGEVEVSTINTTFFHARVQTALTMFLGQNIDLKRFAILGADFGVRTPYGVRGPDLTVDRLGARAKDLLAHKPIIVVEVLSKTSVARDFHEKPEEYLEIDGLEIYLVLSQDDARLWIWQKGRDGWERLPQMVAGLDQSVELKPFGVTLPMAAIYGDLEFSD